jgi:hypothetical protein
MSDENRTIAGTLRDAFEENKRRAANRQKIVFAWRDHGYYLFDNFDDFQLWMSQRGMTCDFHPDKRFCHVYQPTTTLTGTPVSNCQGLAGVVQNGVP